MRSFFAIVAVVSLLSGCASGYTYDGGRYPDKESFNAAVDMKLSQATASVSPLPAPISKKTLVFAIPSEQVIVRQSITNFSNMNGRGIGLGEEIVARPLWNAAYKGLKAFHDAIVRRNIYQNVKYVELDTMAPDLQATATEDAFFYSEAQMGAGQWYYTSAKAGKQAFAFDRGGVDMNARTKAFVDAIQIYAIRD